MRPRLTRRDLLVVLGVGAVAALAVSLGAAALPTAEVGAVVLLVHLTLLLLRERPAVEPRRVRPVVPTPFETARVTVEGALADPLGVEGPFTQVVRSIVRARLDLAGRTPDDVVGGLPPPLRSLLLDRWAEDRGLTPDELELVLTTLEEMDP